MLVCSHCTTPPSPGCITIVPPPVIVRLALLPIDPAPFPSTVSVYPLGRSTPLVAVVIAISPGWGGGGPGGLTVNGALSATGAALPNAAASVYAAPAFLICRFPNVATPATASVELPDRPPLTGFPFWRSARLTTPVKLVALLSSESKVVTTTGGVTTSPWPTSFGSAVKVSFAAGPGTTA